MGKISRQNKVSTASTLTMFGNKGREVIDLVWEKEGISIYRNGKFFKTIVSGDVDSGADPAGNDTEIQYNNGGEFGASSSLTFTEPSGKATITLNSQNLFDDAQIILGLDNSISFNNVLRRLSLTARSGANGDVFLDVPTIIEAPDTEYYHNTVSAAVSSPPTAAEIEANKPNARVLPSSGNQSPSYHLLDTNTNILYKCTYVAGIGWRYLTYNTAV